ncbi:hypothetical protein BU108_03815 [Staphylococcus xylosus]|uniref:hypothetical protein n=1 Tax=Staphylococcus xylosus TaxID=1288 RepID=UPI000D1D2B7A|nr:hypothetical protein [Staphylococcus xylosus]PTH92953.1 hypothetical protein BU108_03815 [Staphylococcus xylosus]
MIKQIYLYDGTPLLLDKDEDGEYIYPSESWTDIPPTSGIYSPFYFDGNEWIGSTREEWENNQPPKEPYIPSKEEEDAAQTQLELFTTQLEVEKLGQDNAEMMKQIYKLKEGINDELS